MNIHVSNLESSEEKVFEGVTNTSFTLNLRDHVQSIFMCLTWEKKVEARDQVLFPNTEQCQKGSEK